MLDILSDLVSVQDSPLTTIAAIQTVIARLTLLIPYLSSVRYGSAGPNGDDANDLLAVENLISRHSWRLWSTGYRRA